MFYQLARMTISVAVTFLFLYIHYEVGKEKWPWKLFYILGDTRFPPFLLIPKTSIYDFFIYQKHQCPINLYILHFQLPSLLCISITIMRLWKIKNHDIYFTFCMTQGFLSSSSDTQNLNLRFHPDHEYQCPINLYTGYFCLHFCMSIRLSGYEREITMMSTPSTQILNPINTISSWHHFSVWVWPVWG